MKRTRMLAALALLLLGAADARAISQELCDKPHATILNVRMETGFRMVFALTREGDNLRGAVEAWQVNGITAGHGLVTGLFGGKAPVGKGLVLEVRFQDRPDVPTSYFKGYLHHGEGEGTALDLARSVPVPAKVSTLSGCARWPEYDAAFCHDYAGQAVAAAREGQARSCGNASGRWSTDQATHFDWCMSLGAAEETPNAETAARTAELNACRAKLEKFDHTYAHPQYFYALTPEGGLVEYVHEILEDRNPQPPNRLEELGVQAKVGDLTQAQAQPAKPELEALGVQSKVLHGAITKDAVVRKDAAVAVEAPRPYAAALAKPQPVIRHNLLGPYALASRFGAGAKVYPAGVYGLGAAVYAVTPDGVMTWQRHDAYRGGQDQWTPPVPVGSGWNDFTRIIAAGDGVLYGVDAAGDLYWLRHLEAANASSAAKWSARTKVGNGWSHFVHLFSTGEGVIYAVLPDGRLLWYRHRGYLTGEPTWDGPKEVGTGWSHFRALFSSGEGRIYAVQPNGDLYAYHHTGYADGRPTWEPYQVLGPGFDRFNALFAAMWGTPAPVR